MRFFRQTLLSVCLILPCTVFAQPVANDDSATTPEDTEIIFNIVSNDSDPSGIDFSSVDLDISTPSSDEKTFVTSAGEFVVDGSGIVTFTPALNFFGDATLSYTVRNSEATPQTSNAGLITVAVTAVDDIPTISSIIDQTLEEDNSTPALGFTVGDVETALVSLSVSRASDNSALIPIENIVLQSLGGTDWTVLVTPLPNQNGEANVTLTVDDGAETANITFKVTVTAVNDVPSFTQGADVTNLEDAGAQSITGWASGIDDGDQELTQGLTFDVTTDNSMLFSTPPSITEDGDLTFTPAANANGTALVTIVLRDDGSGVAPNLNTSSTQTFNINVTEVNDAPVFTKGSDLSVAENSSAQTVSVWATGVSDGDPEVGQTLTFNVSNDNNSLFSAQPAVNASGDLTYTPTAGVSGSATLTITLSDNGSGAAPNVNTSAPQVFTITVGPVNDSPVFTKGANQFINEDAAAQSVAGWATSINDGDPDVTQTLTFNVSNDNNALFSSQPSITAGGTLNYTPAANANGLATVTVALSDDGSGVPPNVNTSAPQVFTISVASVNDAPVFTKGSDLSVAENASGQTIIGWATTISDGDPELAQILAFSVSNDNNGLFSVQPSITENGDLTYTPAPSTNGVAIVTVTLSDDGSSTLPNVNTSAQQTFTITINENSAPTIASIENQSIVENSQTGPLSFIVGDLETTAASLTLTRVSSNVALVTTDNVVLGGMGSLRNVNVIPTLNENGMTTITLTVSDGDKTAQTAFQVMVTALDDPPTISFIADQVINEDNATGLIPFTVDDLDIGPATLTVTGVSDNPTLVPNGNIALDGFGGTNWTVQVTPLPNQNGEANITLTVDDGSETTDLIFKVTVTAVNDVPAFTAGANQTDPEDAGAQSVANWATAITDGDPEVSQTLTFDVNNTNTALFSIQPIISPTGTLTYTPAANANGSATVTVTLSDNGSGVAPNVNTSGPQNFTITVTAVNDAPVFTKGANQTVDENASAQTVSGWATGVGDGDPEVGQTLTFNVSNDNNSLFSAQPTVNASGDLTYTPAAGVSGSATVTITLSDNGSGVAPNVNTSAPQVFTITVAPVNDAPVFTKGANQSVNEDAAAQSVAGWATAISDGDPDVVQILTFNVSNDNNALFSSQPSITAGGTLSYTPAANANGLATVTVTLSDNGSGVPPNVNTSAAQVFTITIAPVNDAPVFTKGANQSVDENAGAQSIGGWATGIGDGDPELSQTLTFNVSNDNNALFSVQPTVTSGGNLSYTPALNANGLATVTITLSDDGSGVPPNANTSPQQTFTITINPVNDAPVFTKGADQSIAEDAAAQSISGWATGINDGDVELTQTLTFNVSNDNNTLFSVQPSINAAGTLTYTPAANANGVTTVTVTLSDNGSGAAPNVNTSGPQTFTITINPINDAPTITTISNQTINEDNATGDLSFTIGDLETAAGSLNVTASSSNTTIVPNANITLGGSGTSRTINITPVAELSGVTTITVNVSDGSITTPRTFTVTVNPVNDAPTITGVADQSIAEDTPTAALDFTVDDVETAPGSLTVTRSSSNTTLVPTANVVLGGSGTDRTVTVTPALNQTGVTIITLTVDDGTESVSTDFQVTVTGVNDPPTITAITDRTINEDSQTGVINFTVGDPETAASALVVSGSSSNTALVSNANVVLAGSGAARTVNVIPTADQFGVTVITLEVSDGVNTATRTFEVTVNAVNDVPVITNQVPITINEVQPVVLSVGQLTILDPDNVFPTDFTLIVTGGSNYTITGSNTITPFANFSGVLTVPVFVSDGAALSPIYNLQISVNSVNDKPVITNQVTLSMNEDESLEIEFDDLIVNDPDNPNYPVGFSLTVLPGTNYGVAGTTISPTLNFNGVLTVNVKVNDGLLDSDTYGLQVTVNAVNDPPVITAQASLSTNEDVAITLTVGNFTVTDPEPTTYTLSVSQTAGTNYTVSGNQITPNPNYFGPLSVPVTVSDGALNSVVYNAQIQVNSINDLPVINDQVPLTTVEDIPLVLGLSDLIVTDVDNTTYPVGFTMSVQGGTNYTFSGTTVTPAADYVGPLFVSVTVNDGTGNSAPYLVEIEVTPDTDAPVIINQSAVSVNEDEARTIVLTDLVVQDPDTPIGQITVIVLPGTNYTITGNEVKPNANFFGTLTVNVMVNDGMANSNTYPLQVTVISKNDPPSFNAIANVAILEDAAQQTITVTGISPGPLEIQPLLMSALSDNQDLVEPTWVYNGGTTATISFTPKPNMFGTAIITVKFVDPDFSEIIKTFTITVTSVNDAPTLAAITVAPINEDAPEQLIPLTGITVGGGALENVQILSIIPSSTNNDLFEVLEPDYQNPSSTGTLRIKPKANANGTVQITVRVQDSGPGAPAPNVNFVIRTFTLVINAVNDLPEFISEPVVTAEPGISYSYPIDVTDADGEAMTLTAPTLPSWLTFTPGTNGKGTLSGAPPAGTTGDVEVVIIAKDPSGGPIEQRFTININSRPILSPITIVAAEDVVLQFNTATQQFSEGFYDLDVNPLAELQITELPKRGVLKFDGNAFAVGYKLAAADLSKLTYTPMVDSTGTDTLRWNASDGFFLYALLDTYAVLNVLPSNDAPIITYLETDTLKYELGSEVPVFWTTAFDGYDPDGDELNSAEIGFKRIDNYRYSPENDRLLFEGKPKISGEFDEGAGILKLSGKATAKEYVEAIRSIQYNYIDVKELEAELSSPRSLYITLSDGLATSLQSSRIVKLVYTFSDLNIPTAFTPNVGDDVNKTWKISSLNGTEQYDDAEIKVYNKRGLLLFETKGFEKPWDGLWNGEVLPSDTYFYTIDLNYNKVRYKGTVTILR